MHEAIQDLQALDLIADPLMGGAVAGDGLSVDVDALTAAQWDRIIAGFDDLHLFQTAAFADGLRGERHLSHLLLRRGGAPVAGARVAIMKPPGLPIGIAYVKYGPFWRRAGTAPDQATYRAIVAAVIDEYAGRRGHMISICPRPHPHFHAVEERVLAECGFALRSVRTRPLTYFLVNTGLDEKAMRASLAQTWRHNLKQSERKDLDIRFCDPMQALGAFHALHDSMLARKKFVSRDPLHTLPRIFRQLPPGNSHIVTAAHQGEVVAAAVLILGGDVAYYLYGASADAALSLRAGYALHWRIACWLAERGIAWYDLGDAFGALRQFKEGFVGKTGAALSPRELDFWLKPQARVVGTTMYRARDLVTSLRGYQKWAYKTITTAGRPR